jgi:serine/threonine-protein kinase
MARILDFGLADLAGRTTVGTDVLLSNGDDTGVTGVVGNPEYISPEQARGRAVSSAGDLYQVGALLYFLLTGQAPFPRASAAQVLEAHITAPPPVPSALVAAARPLDRVVTRAMAKEPEDRFPDAAAFSEALDAAVARVGLTQRGSGAVATYSPTRVMAVGGRPELPGSARAELHGIPDDSPVEPAASRSLVGSTTRTASEPPARNTAAIVAVAAIVGVALVAVVSTFAAPVISAHPLPSGSPSVTEPASPTPTPTPTPTRASLSAQVSVPTLHGKLTAAERTLRQAGLTLGQVSRADSAESAGTVLGQSPDPGAVVARGTAVDLQIASGSNLIPATAGLSAAAAVATLESAGFRAATNRAVVDATAIVLRTEPAEGTVLRLGVTITLILDSGPAPTPTPTPTPTSSAP